MRSVFPSALSGRGLDGRSSKQGGFTIIEVLVVVALLAILSVPLFGMFGSGFVVVGESRSELAAATVAQSMMERIISSRGLGYVIDAVGSAPRPVDAASPYGQNAPYTYLLHKASAGNLDKYTLVLYWQDRLTPRQYKVVTLVGR